MRVLVVEDDEVNRDCLKLLLKLWGHNVCLACDGPSALKTSRSFAPQAVLLDIELPGLNGWEVARRLRQQKDLRPLLLVAMTGHARDEDRRRAREVGFDVHLIKPLDPRELQALLANGHVREAAEDPWEEWGPTPTAASKG